MRKSFTPSMGELDELESLKAGYSDIIGLVPRKVETRFRVSSALDPEQLRLQEAMRVHCMHPPYFDVKTTQLIAFGMLLMDLWEGSRFHAIAARRAGASWEELHAVVAMSGLMRGLTAMNFGADILDQVMRTEHNAAAENQEK
jgi:4-carboxymuconolactone decarboxylase